MAQDKCTNLLVEKHGQDPEEAKAFLDYLAEGGSSEKIFDRAERLAANADFHKKQRANEADLMQHAFETAYNFITEGATSYKDAVSRFKIYLTGSTKEGTGFLKSIGHEMEARTATLHGRIQMDFINATGLSRTEMHKLFRSKKFQQDVVRERFPFQEKSVTGNNQAYEMAKILERENMRVVQESNFFGASIIYNPKHVTIQYHNVTDMKLAQMQEWVDFVMPLLDEDTTFNGFPPNRQILEDIYSRLTDKKEIKDKTVESMSDALSASRRLHFKDADAWITYNQRFGHQDPLNAMIEGLTLQSDRSVLIKRLGPDPQTTFDNLKEAIMSQYKVSKATFAGSGVDTRYDVLSGRNYIPENPTLTKIFNGYLNWHIITDMGKAMLSSFSDPLFQAMTMHYQGKSFFSAYYDTFRNLKKSITKDMDITEKDMFKYLGLGIDGILTSSSSRYFAQDRLSGSLSKMADAMFMYNGLNFWTNANREGFARMASAYMGDMSLLKWNELSESYKRVLNQYDISESDWALINKAGPYNITEQAALQGRTIDSFANELYFTPDHLKNFSASKQAQQLADKLEIFFVTESRMAVPQPGKNEKAIMSFGFKRGTVPGVLAETFWMFRSFPLTMAIQQYPRMMQNGLGNSSLHLAPAIMLGYASLTAKDLFRGREPKDPFAASTAAASLVQSGVAGIVGDFVYNNFSAYNYGWPEIAFGPAAGDVRDSVRLFQGLINGDEDAAKAWSVVKSNIPFGNLFYLEPAINYGLLYHVQEYVNPGYLGRMENAIKSMENQDYIEAIRPSAVVGGY